MLREKQQIELRHFSSVVWRHRWIVLATTIAAAAIALALALRAGSTYEASSTLRLTTPTALSGGTVRADSIEYTDRLENTYAELLESASVRQELGVRLGLAGRPDVRVEARPKTELFDVVGSASTRAEAVLIADGAAALLLERVAELAEQSVRTSDALFEQRITDLEAQLAEDRKRRRALVGKKSPALVAERRTLLGGIRTSERALVEQRAAYESERLARGERTGALAVVSAAEPPSGEAGPAPILIGVAGGLIGLLAALGLAFVLENLRPRKRSQREIEDLLDVPVLGRIPSDIDGDTGEPADPRARDAAFRHLRMTLLANLDSAGKAAVLLTGTGESGQHIKLANNLAKTLAEGGRSVVVVDGDVRGRFDDGTSLSFEELGLADVLERRRLPNDIVLQGVVDGVSVLPAGRSSERAVALLSSTAMRDVVASLQERFEMVLIVGPPLDGTPDALALAAAAGAAVVVVDSEEVSFDMVADARRQLRQVHARVIGLVVHGHDVITPPPSSQRGSSVEYA